MSTPLVAKFKRTLTSNGTSATIDLPGPVDNVVVKDISNLNSPANNEFVSAEWANGMGNGTALVRSYTGAAPATSVAQVSTGGISLVDTSGRTVGASVATTAVSNAAPAVVSTGTTTGLVANESIVRMFDTVNMRQIAGIEYTVGTVNAGTNFELRWLDSTNFEATAGGGAAPGVAGSYRIISNPPQYSPRQFFISNISAAANARVTLTVTHDIQVGEQVALVVPSLYGMEQADGLRGEVVAVNQADASGFTNTVDLDVSTAGFTAFRFPASSQVPSNFAQLIRFGNESQSVLASTDNISAFQLQFGSAAVGDNLDQLVVEMESGMDI